VIDGQLRRQIMNHAAHDELRRCAMAAGMVSLKDEGLAKARLGITSLLEVSRVAQDWGTAD